MDIRTYCGGHYLKACNSIMYWIIGEDVFIELNRQGLKYSVYDSLDSFYEDKRIFEIDYDPERYFPNEDEPNSLEEERISDEIKEFLINYITSRERRCNEAKSN